MQLFLNTYRASLLKVQEYSFYEQMFALSLF